jgi:uncharacterized protein (DUF2235 family)
MSKNIVLLSDGTGNSAAKPFKTNIWRLYQALDTAPPQNPSVPLQIVFYDNGVGTENFKPLAVLAGAFGLGVWRNVRDLYTFVCRNYQPGDKIYAFGFSRGAFTVRLLMGMIGKCGIVQARVRTEAKLLEAVQMAYEAFRRDFLVRASEQRPGMFYHRLLSRPRLKQDKDGNKTIALPDEELTQSFVDISLVGVWDTVDAYGMPVDELKHAIDRCVWPMSFADRELSPRIVAARHALSLDDERPTFRPVLWNEVVKNKDVPGKSVVLSADRIQQVWFSGVHSNVGGGYADDGLAFVSLEWMMTEARKAGLRFTKESRTKVQRCANPHGEQYDSRSGIAGYYRYGPRKLAELCKDDEHGVEVAKVNVHPSVLERIARHQVEYAPVSLDCPFQVLGGSQRYEPDEEALEVAKDVVWWRRLAYFATVGLTVFIGLFALRPVWSLLKAGCSFVTLPLIEALPGTADKIASGLRWTKDTILGVLPDQVLEFHPDWIVLSFREHPLTAVLSLGILAWLFFRKSEDLQDRIKARAEWAWRVQKNLEATHAPKPGGLNRFARHARPVTAWLYRYYRKVVALVLGVAIGSVAIIPVALFALWRALFRRPKWVAEPRSAPRGIAASARLETASTGMRE